MDLTSKKKLEDLRSSIDRLDTVMVNILAERFKQTDKVGILKVQAGLDALDPKREQEQMERLIGVAKEANLNSAFAENFLNVIRAEVKRNHKKLQQIETKKI